MVKMPLVIKYIVNIVKIFLTQPVISRITLGRSTAGAAAAEKVFRPFIYSGQIYDMIGMLRDA